MRKFVRALIARSSKHLGRALGDAGRSTTALVVALGLVAVAVIGSTVGYAMLSKTVQVSIDGEQQTITGLGGTVGEILRAEGIEVGPRDVVSPGLDEEVVDGSSVTVRYARRLELVVDGESETHWVTANAVQDALSQIGKGFARADLSVSRSAAIDRAGMAVEVTTPKTFRVTVGAKKPIEHELAALTVQDVLDELGLSLRNRDKVEPDLSSELPDGGEVVLTRIKTVQRQVTDEVVEHRSKVKKDPSRYDDERSVEVEGVDGLRDVVYRDRIVNGQVVRSKPIKTKVTRKPVTEVVSVGTKERGPNYAGGDTVWDRLAQCESGGNWSINTGNGYYGGLQFSAATWRAVGGTGLPHQHSREEQIRRGKILQARSGWGQWPHCTRKLGLR